MSMTPALRNIERRNEGDDGPLSVAVLVTDHRRERFAGPRLVGIPEQRLEKLGNAATAMFPRPLDRLAL